MLRELYYCISLQRALNFVKTILATTRRFSLFVSTNNSETTSRKQCFFLFMSLVKINTLSCASLLGPLLSLIKLTITARNGESKIEGKSSETMQKMCLCLHLSPSCRGQPANQRARCVVFGRLPHSIQSNICFFFCVHALQDEHQQRCPYRILNSNNNFLTIIKRSSRSPCEPRSAVSALFSCRKWENSSAAGCCCCCC